MSTTNVSRESRDELLVAVLATGATQAQAGARVGMSDRTIRRRLEDHAFVERVRTARNEMITRAGGQAAALVADAVGVLGSLLEAESEATRLRAAQAVLDAARRLVTEETIGARLERLEQEMLENRTETS